jgi:hypothetical protein
MNETKDAFPLGLDEAVYVGTATHVRLTKQCVEDPLLGLINDGV